MPAHFALSKIQKKRAILPLPSDIQTLKRLQLQGGRALDPAGCSAPYRVIGSRSALTMNEQSKIVLKIILGAV